MAADRWSDLLTLLAALTGASVLALVWPRPRRARTARLRHPSTPPPIVVELNTEGAPARWRVSTPAHGPTTTLDIFTWHPTGSSLPWVSEPIVDPVVLEPGSSVVLDSVVSDPTAPHDVVLAWTVHRPDGHIQGSRTVHVEPGVSLPLVGTITTVVERPWAHRVLVAGCVLLAGALVVVGIVSGSRLLDGPEDRGLDSDVVEDVDDVGTATSSVATATPPDDGSAATPPPTPAPVTAPPSTADPSADPSTTPATTPPTTSAATTASTATATVPDTTDSPAPTTVPAVTDATTVATVASTDGRTLTVFARIDECRFGSDCLIADFSLTGFEASGEYVCEFGDGSRFVFRYIGADAEDVCATSGDSITIEVDGVRSATATRASIG